MQERRRFSRSSVGIHTEVRAADGTVASGHSCDVSLKGFRVTTDRVFTVGTKCEVVFFLDTGSEEIPIRVSGAVSRAESTGMGIEIVSMELEAFQQLKELVRANASDPDKVDDEFTSHIRAQSERPPRA